MPRPEGAMLLHPEAALLKWQGERRCIDIGQLCYLSRETSRRHRLTHTFDESSIDAERVQTVRRLIDYISDVQRLANMRPLTMVTRTRHLVMFVNWADKQGLRCTLSEKGSMESAYGEYVKAQRELVSQNRLNRNTAANGQRDLRVILAGFFNTERFAADVLTMKGSKKHVENTPVPDQMSQAALVGWCSVLFAAISERVLEFGTYPFVVNGVDFQTGVQKMAWMLPTHLGWNEAKLRHCLDAWNPETGEVRTREEIRGRLRAESLSSPEVRATDIRAIALAQLRRANESRVANIRLNHAFIASYCFSVLFLAETGINISQLTGMKWSPELDKGLKSPSVVRQRFREIKYRAGGRVVSFQVGLGFLPKLKVYLRLREYILRGAEIAPLFVGFGKDHSPAGLSNQFISLLQRRLNRLGIVLPRLSARKWRAAKQDWVISNHGPDVAAKVMGHTLDTAMRSYSNGTDAAHRAEMGSFLASVEQTVLRADERSSVDVESSVGVCKRFNNPKSISPSVAIKPNCHSSEGCLFCDKYRAHADATDIRKLLSCRYCVRIAGNRGASLEEYERSFGAVLRRIEFLLEELRKREDILVAQIQEDVDVNGNLDFFWATKLEQLFELGLA